MSETMRRYKVDSRHSTVCGYPGRDFDWSLFCWDGSAAHKGEQAPLPWVDDGLIEPNCEYLHVPYDWARASTIYRVRPNESMRAGQLYRGLLVQKQKAVKLADGWYWALYGIRQRAVKEATA